MRYLAKWYKNNDSKGYMYPNIYSRITYNSQTMETAEVSINWWMEKEVAYTYEEYSSGVPGWLS